MIFVSVVFVAKFYSTKVVRTMPPKAFWLFDEKFSIQTIQMDNDLKMGKREKGYIVCRSLPSFPSALLFSAPSKILSF